MIRALGAVALVLPSIAGACSCIQSVSPSPIGDADVILHGRVLTAPTREHGYFTLAVVEPLYGPTRGQLFIVTSAGECGVPLEVQEEYLVYGYRRHRPSLLEHTYEINACTTSLMRAVPAKLLWTLRALRDAQRSSSTGLRLRL